MKRVIPFNRFRYVAYTFSLVIIIAGIGGTLLFKGYNVGVDFKGGLSQQVQIAPLAFSVTNASNRFVDFEINAGEVSYIKSGEKKMVFPRTADQTLADLAKNLESAGDLKVTMAGGAAAVPVSLLVPVHRQLDLKASLNVNRGNPAGTKPQATIGTVRGLLDSLPGGVSIQEVGDPAGQTFLVRTDPTAFKPAPGEDAADTAGKAVIAAIEKQFGAGSIVEQSNESLGPQMAQSLAVGSVIAIAIALALMLVYVAIRFRVNYATAAVLALVHDSLTTLAFVGIFQVELNTAVVAAILTIIGYSINDTIVIYDRIRENGKLMKGQDPGFIMNASITQTLGRTFITSFTVFMAIFPLYLFGTGPVKDFSLAMIWGIVTGVYSTVFIASPIALSWQQAVDKARRNKEIRLYGQVRTPTFEAGVPGQPMSGAIDDSGTAGTDGTTPTAAPEGTSGQPNQTGSVPAGVPPFIGTGTGPITRVQRVLEKKKKRRH